MRHIIFQPSPDNRYPIAVLIKGAAFNQHALKINYIDPLNARGIASDQVIAFTLEYNPDNKAPAKLIKGYLESLLPAVNSLGVQYLYVADGNYFKTLTKKTKAEPHVGYALPCAIEGYEHIQVVLGLNYQALVYDPNQLPKLVMGLDVLAGTINGTHQQLGADIIQFAEYPEELGDIAAWLQKLHQHPVLTVDIEGFSLEFNKCGIGSISFAWNKHEGIGFLCDYKPFTDPNDVLETGLHGYYQANPQVRHLLRKFFTEYKGTVIFHNACFDVRVLIFYLWMEENLLDRVGLLEGLDIMYRDLHDTKIITYLATNSTAGNELSLKKQAHEYTGNYAQDEEDIKDIRRIPPDELLEYNVVDCLATWFVKDKNWPIMVQDKQLDLYTHLFLPSLVVITQMELVGMPMKHSRIMEAKAQLEAQEQACLHLVMNHPLIKALSLVLTEEQWTADFESRKAKAKNPDKIKPKDRSTFPIAEFNPNSGPQLQHLLYNVMGLPVIDTTDSGLPATGGDTLKKLLNYCHTDAHKEIINALRDYSKVTKILTAFIPAFEKALDKGDGRVWLHGSFNLGGTVSGRLSSSKPNLQQIPANSTYGKLIKSCFGAPDGWLFVGADFNSLEDYISALTTKDPNKLNVYIKGYDGHCLRACSYFADELRAEGLIINMDDPKSVNQLKKMDHPLRQESKAPTFALTYQGTAYTLMANLGWSKEKAEKVEANYHDLYKVSDAYVDERLRRACRDGYVEVAFGLRVRTPLLAKTLWDSPKIPAASKAEGRTAGNALGQSYGLLNNRAANAFMKKVWASPYRYDILPVALIHDAIYLLIRDRLDVIEWVNNNLIGEMRWQKLPEIQHDTVKLGAALDIFWPDWAHPVTLPNDCDYHKIIEVCKAHKEEILNPKESA